MAAKRPNISPAAPVWFKRLSDDPNWGDWAEEKNRLRIAAAGRRVLAPIVEAVIAQLDVYFSETGSMPAEGDYTATVEWLAGDRAPRIRHAQQVLRALFPYLPRASDALSTKRKKRKYLHRLASDADLSVRTYDELKKLWFQGGRSPTARPIAVLALEATLAGKTWSEIAELYCEHRGAPGHDCFDQQCAERIRRSVLRLKNVLRGVGVEP